MLMLHKSRIPAVGGNFGIDFEEDAVLEYSL
jgi:hypothetical protein